jgi:hypothetical protein
MQEQRNALKPNENASSEDLITNELPFSAEDLQDFIDYFLVQFDKMI